MEEILAALAKVRGPSTSLRFAQDDREREAATKFGSLVRRRLPYDVARTDGGIAGD
jgi:hypothetical protein